MDTMTLSEIETGAHQAATSPLSALPEPTDAQKKAGNYQKGHVRLQGIDIAIENPEGSVRSGPKPDGGEWMTVMRHHYGYVKRTEGADGDQVDVFIGPEPESPMVFVIDQKDQDSGEFDEHKVMLGFPNYLAAVHGYRRNYDAGWKVGPVTTMTMDEFKAWLRDGDNTVPASDRKRQSNLARLHAAVGRRSK